MSSGGRVSGHLREERVGVGFDALDADQRQRFEPLHRRARVWPALAQLGRGFRSPLAQVLQDLAGLSAQLGPCLRAIQRAHTLHQAAQRLHRERLSLRECFGGGAFDGRQGQLDHRTDRSDVIARQLLQKAQELILEDGLGIDDRAQRLQLVLGKIGRFRADFEHDPQHSPRPERAQDTRAAAHLSQQLGRHEVAERLPERDRDRDAREDSCRLCHDQDAFSSVSEPNVVGDHGDGEDQQHHPEPGLPSFDTQRRAPTATHHGLERRRRRFHARHVDRLGRVVRWWRQVGPASSRLVRGL